MIEWLDTAPVVQVAATEYQRLLGYPAGHAVDGRAAELAGWAHAWYAEHGRPWTYARQVRELAIDGTGVRLDGDRFSSARLARLCREAGATSAVMAVVSAGVELEQASAALWREEKPDEYFFLEIFGSAVVEHLVMQTGARLCAWADTTRMAVLPHDSPGYTEWDIAEQPRLLSRIRDDAGTPWPEEVDALPSGALMPKKSLLAVFGLTPQVDRVRRLTTLVPCQSCALPSCRYRRLPYARYAIAVSGDEDVTSGPVFVQVCSAPDRDEETGAFSDTGHAPVSSRKIDVAARYRLNARALRRWADERLTLRVEPDETVTAWFRYDGTTCTNMGRPLAFVYEVRLGSRAEGFPVRALQCAPAPGDTGHEAMCRYVKDPDALMTAIATETPPVLDAPLDAALAWAPQSSPAGCYCDVASREHKWGLVLETIHFALARREAAGGRRDDSPEMAS